MTPPLDALCASGTELLGGLAGSAPASVAHKRALFRSHCGAMAFGVPLRGYQVDGVAWLLFMRRHGLHGVLADDMGLGKTVQALAVVFVDALEQVRGAAGDHSTSDDCGRVGVAGGGGGGGTAGSRSSGGGPLPSLIVCPSSVMHHWWEECVRHQACHGGVVVPLLYSGTPEERRRSVGCRRQGVVCVDPP
jgi:SNF2 family DNA or RNA helicase